MAAPVFKLFDHMIEAGQLPGDLHQRNRRIGAGAAGIDELAQPLDGALRANFAEAHHRARIGQRLEQHVLGAHAIVALKRRQEPRVQPVVDGVEWIAEEVALEKRSNSQLIETPDIGSFVVAVPS